jgi:N-methylhydantoinase A/oxoprolinase/acetone carboxylase beta subunit
VTDANLFLGRLDPGYFLGGRMTLDTSAAAKALRSVGEQVGLGDVAFAEGMLAIVNANMADAMRTITVKQGIDPREYSLVAFGGAGPMHAVWLAEVEAAFHEGHRVRYGHSTPGAPVEIVNLRLAALGRIATAAVPYRAPDEGVDPSLGRRAVVFGGEEHDTPAVLRGRLRPGDGFDGPLIVEDETATTVIPPAHALVVDDFGNLLIARQA